MNRIVMVMFLLAACDTTSGDDEPVQRNGHERLFGGTWSVEVDRGDVAAEIGFTFGTHTAIASSDCYGTGHDPLHVEVEVPIAYLYSVTTTQPGAAGDIACGVTLAAGRYDFLIIDGGIQVTAGEQVFELAQNGSTDGIFGTWSTPTNDGSMSWTIAANALRITRFCSGVSPDPVVLTVPAETRGFLRFLQAKEDYAEDGDFSCRVTSQTLPTGYTFDGDDTLTLHVEDDDPVTLTRKP